MTSAILTASGLVKDYTKAPTPTAGANAPRTLAGFAGGVGLCYALVGVGVACANRAEVGTVSPSVTASPCHLPHQREARAAS